MFSPPVEEVVNLLPCTICSAPFDPATLPSHVYDPYQTFLLFTPHRSICPSCFAEELAKRTGPPEDALSFPADDELEELGCRQRSDSTATVVAESRSVHRKASSLATLPRSPLGPDTRSLHRKASSATTFSRPESSREVRSLGSLRRQHSLNYSRKSQDTYRTRPSTSTGYYSTPSQRPSPELPQRSQRPSPDLSRPSQDQLPSPTRPSSQSTRKSGDLVRRKVSFSQSAPSSKSFNPSSPPLPASRIPTVPEQSHVNLPPPIPIPRRTHSANSAARSSRRQDRPIRQQPLPPQQRVQTSPSPSSSSFSPSTFSWSAWRGKRQAKREAREQRWQLRKERQRARHVREQAEMGIGLDLFCPECRLIVRTEGSWHTGSCCFLYTSCLAVTTGPLSLLLLLPCASHHVLDVHGVCPSCSTTLCTWNRRKNRLTVLTWAGVPNASPSPPLPRPSTTSTRPRTTATMRSAMRPGTAISHAQSTSIAMVGSGRAAGDRNSDGSVNNTVSSQAGTVSSSHRTGSSHATGTTGTGTTLIESLGSSGVETLDFAAATGLAIPLGMVGEREEELEEIEMGEVGMAIG